MYMSKSHGNEIRPVREHIAGKVNPENAREHSPRDQRNILMYAWLIPGRVYHVPPPVMKESISMVRAVDPLVATFRSLATVQNAEHSANVSDVISGIQHSGRA